MLYALLAIVILIVAIIWWLYTSVARGTILRDEKLLKRLDPIAERMTRKEQVERSEITALAQEP